MCKKYCIVIYLKVINSWFLSRYWEDFERKNKRSCSLVISIVNKFIHHYGLDLLPPQSGPVIFKSQNTLVSANSDWSEATITLLDGREDGIEGALSAIVMTHLSTRHGLMVHSSLIDVNGRGILFIGPSGIGKTTQAEQWQKYRDAMIINGDMALVHYDGERYFGHGCPWHGSSPYCENRKVPLAGIVVLEQAMTNSIERLSGIRMIERVTQNVFLPKWYEEGVEKACETLDGLLTDIPVYLLRCRIDEEAVELVERALFESL